MKSLWYSLFLILGFLLPFEMGIVWGNEMVELVLKPIPVGERHVKMNPCVISHYTEVLSFRYQVMVEAGGNRSVSEGTLLLSPKEAECGFANLNVSIGSDGTCQFYFSLWRDQTLLLEANRSCQTEKETL